MHLLRKVHKKVLNKINPFHPKIEERKKLNSSIIYETFNEQTLSDTGNSSSIQKFDSNEEKKLEEEKLIEAQNLVKKMMKMRIQLKKKVEERKKNNELKIEKEMDEREYQNKLILMHTKNEKKLSLLKRIEQIQSRTKNRIIKLEKLKFNKIQGNFDDSCDHNVAQHSNSSGKKIHKQKNNFSLEIKSVDQPNIFNIKTIPIKIHNTSEIQKKTQVVKSPQKLPKIYKSKFLLEAMRDRILNKQMQIYEKINKKQLSEKMKTYGILVNEIGNPNLLPLNFGINNQNLDIPINSKQSLDHNFQSDANNEISTNLINSKGHSENMFYPSFLEKKNFHKFTDNIPSDYCRQNANLNREI